MSRPRKSGKLFVIGIGPGPMSYLCEAARSALDGCQAVVGYRRYTKLLAPLLSRQTVYSFGMREEALRCQKAIDLALSGLNVALVSSGDPGVYGMAGLTLEVIQQYKDKVEVEVIPGISALNYAAALLGAPINNDFAVISLSDILTPWEKIEKRIEAASKADFVIVFYNPKSSRRRWQIEAAITACLKWMSEKTPVGIVRQETDGPAVEFADLEGLSKKNIDMLTTIIVGNSTTTMLGGRMVTPRGYRI